MKSSHMLSFTFYWRFFADFRASAVKGSHTSFEILICVFIFMPYHFIYIENIILDYLEIVAVSWILLSYLKLTTAIIKIFADAYFCYSPTLFPGKTNKAE